MEYTLTKHAVLMLRQLIEAPGRAGTWEDIYRGGKLLAEVLPKFDSLTVAQAKEEVKFEMDEKQVELCKTAFTSSVKNIPTNDAAMELIEKLGIAPKA